MICLYDLLPVGINMSGTPIDIEVIRKYLKCIFCLKLATEPIPLPCFHIICSVCLDELDGRIRDVKNEKLNCTVCECPFSSRPMENTRECPFLSNLAVVAAVEPEYGVLCGVCAKTESNRIDDIPEADINGETALAAEEDQQSALSPPNASVSSGRTHSPHSESTYLDTCTTQSSREITPEFQSHPTSAPPQNMSYETDKDRDSSWSSPTALEFINPSFEAESPQSLSHAIELGSHSAEAPTDITPSTTDKFELGCQSTERDSSQSPQNTPELLIQSIEAPLQAASHDDSLPMSSPIINSESDGQALETESSVLERLSRNDLGSSPQIPFPPMPPRAASTADESETTIGLIVSSKEASELRSKPVDSAMRESACESETIVYAIDDSECQSRPVAIPREESDCRSEVVGPLADDPEYKSEAVVSHTKHESECQSNNVAPPSNESESEPRAVVPGDESERQSKALLSPGNESGCQSKVSVSPQYESGNESESLVSAIEESEFKSGAVAPPINELECQSKDDASPRNESECLSNGNAHTTEVSVFQSEAVAPPTNESDDQSKAVVPTPNDSECQPTIVPPSEKCCSRFCGDCSLDMCESCSVEHTSKPSSKEHYIWVTSEAPDISKLVQCVYTTVNTCEQKHSFLKFCHDCNRRFCPCEKHETHKWENISEMKKERTELASCVALFDEVLEMVDQMRKTSLASEIYGAVNKSNAAKQSSPSARRNEGSKQSRGKRKSKSRIHSVDSDITSNKGDVEAEVEREALYKRWRQYRMRFDNMSLYGKMIIQFGQPDSGLEFETTFRESLRELICYLPEQTSAKLLYDHQVLLKIQAEQPPTNPREFVFKFSIRF